LAVCLSCYFRTVTIDYSCRMSRCCFANSCSTLA
jgi:hypothetical protein